MKYQYTFISMLYKLYTASNTQFRNLYGHLYAAYKFIWLFICHIYLRGGRPFVVRVCMRFLALYAAVYFIVLKQTLAYTLPYEYIHMSILDLYANV